MNAFSTRSSLPTAAALERAATTLAGTRRVTGLGTFKPVRVVIEPIDDEFCDLTVCWELVAAEELAVEGIGFVVSL